ncbi:hypothetical protein CBQ28_16935 [Pseudoalteromonas sp. GCY]|uniref:hypothetical protein n=1 Tax=Pseudoalteromonas sp. GCY TaxID=2003316 RepID=UPI000BFECA7C|nr:hypothetical protein [Pseudoalteromonas sp. GCY]PHI35948.1 hypothetical protein CBQ28_16935 [Pseudoalteromonas sp. GCY]QQQ68574.1 hypothetical protein JJQ94_12585 [Pseudoalteromonas sp. GCY]
MSQKVEITLTGVANVKITKHVTLPKAEADKLLADDSKMQEMLTRHNSVEVKDWDHVFGQKLREFAIATPEPGFACANHHCGWVGNESDKAAVYVGELLSSACPKCHSVKFYKVQQVVPRG